MTSPVAASVSAAPDGNLAPIFISHGSPMLVARQSTPAFDFFARDLGDLFDGARAILIVSAHWQTATPTISTAARPEATNTSLKQRARTRGDRACKRSTPATGVPR